MVHPLIFQPLNSLSLVLPLVLLDCLLEEIQFLLICIVLALYLLLNLMVNYVILHFLVIHLIVILIWILASRWLVRVSTLLG